MRVRVVKGDKVGGSCSHPGRADGKGASMKKRRWIQKDI